MSRGGRTLWRVLLAALCIAPTAVALLPATPAAAASWTPVYNIDFPDPSISDFGGVYWAYSTQSGFANVPSATSTDLINWTGTGGNIFPTLPLWATFGFTWAPTVQRTPSGQYVMFYVARDTAAGVQCIGRATALAPNGPFIDSSLGPVVCQTNIGGDIDPDIFTADDGSSYLTWKSDGNSSSDLAGLWAQPLDSNFNLTGGPKLLLTNGGQAWQGQIVEGPAMVQLNGEYYLFYSGNDYDTAQYAIGYTTCTTPMGPCANTQFNPVLGTSKGMSGPGGETFFKSPSGQLLMGFAAWPGAVGYPAGHRALFIATVGVSNGVPYFDPYNGVQPDSGYWQTGSDGGVFTFGSAGYYGSTGAIHLNRPIVGMAPTPDGKGYWLVASDGGIFAFGDAGFYGSTGALRLNKPIVGMAATADGKGYWLVASDGGIFSFGDAAFEGSTGNIRLNKPIVGMAVDGGNGGYWLVASDGGIFAFGNAPFYGSTGAIALAKPIVGMAALPDGAGYWLTASDGGVFSFNATFYGSAAGNSDSPVTGITSTADGGGYWLTNAAGDVYDYGDAPQYGEAATANPAAPMIGMGATNR